MRLTRMRVVATLCLPLFLVACSKSTSPSKAKTERPSAAIDARSAPPVKKKRKARGWEGYSGKRTTGSEDLPPAADASLLDQSGNEVKLASFWKTGKALIVFYRGHW